MSSLYRKVRRVGNSLVITIPSHIADANDIADGAVMEIRMRGGNIVLKKVVTYNE